MRFLALALIAAAASLPAAAADRFATRAFQTGKQSVYVDARGDVFSVRFSGLPAQHVGVIVDDAVAKVTRGTVQVERAWRLTQHDLVAIAVSTALTPQQLRDVSALVELEGGRLWPALTRPGTQVYNRAFYDDRVLVTAEPGKLDDVISKIVSDSRGTLIAKSRWLKNTAVVAVGVGAEFDAVAASASFSGMPGVVSVEPDLYRELQTNAVADDPLFELQWHLARNDDQNVPGDGTIHADLAWDITKGDPDVVVAVFDSGTDWNHPDLLPNVNQELMFDASDADDFDPSPECQGSQDGIDFSPICEDLNGNEPFRESHGTSVSGTIAAVGDNQIGLAGVCPQCSLAPVRLLGDATNNAMSIAESFSRSCDPTANGTGQGAWIINNSWGPGFSLFFPLSQPERDAFDLCRDVGRGGKGTVIVFAAGNETSNVASDAYAKHPYVIGVAASTNIDDWAAYSNFGAEIDVAAPSLGGVTQQDNFGIVTTDVRGNEGYSVNGTNVDGTDIDVDYTDSFSGTSAASPVTAGVAGLLLSANPDLSAEQVRLILTSTADKIEADEEFWESAFQQELDGFFDYDETGHSTTFGYGRVNAAAAVALAADPVALLATLENAGARCDETTCNICSPEGTCLAACATQDDCADGSVCNTATGACDLPRVEHTAFLEICNADCPFCVPTLDTEFNTASVCSKECSNDASCDPRCADGDPECQTDSFDCRPIGDDPTVGGICAVGSPDSGGPADFNACGFNEFVGLPTLVLSDDGKELCGESCFEDAPGACPYGFTCGEAVCECTRVNQNGDCRELTCGPALAGQGQLPLCLPNPGHADICKFQEDCQRGDYCFIPDGASVGECRFDDRDGCDICASCLDSSECGGRGACLGVTEQEAGVCTIACDDGEPCPDGSVCRTISVRSFGGRLRQFDACLSDGGDEGNPEVGPQEACGNFECEVPECREDIPCPSGQECDGGECVDVQEPAEGEGEGEGGDGVVTLGGGGMTGCGGCSSTNSVSLMGFAALLLLLRRRRR